MNKTKEELKQLSLQHIRPVISTLVDEDVIMVAVIKNNNAANNSIGISATGGLTTQDVIAILEGTLAMMKQEPFRAPEALKRQDN